MPIADPKLESVKKLEIMPGDLPSLINPPSGCNFRTRCPIADSECAKSVPILRKLNNGSQIRCIKI